jgi:UDP:flavonoid glycosyltransferase YjiC (YdhE family)
MARVLAYTSPAQGHLFPTIAILEQLAERGHEVSVRTLAAQVPLLQTLGFAAAPIDGRIEAIEQDDGRATSGPPSCGWCAAWPNELTSTGRTCGRR